MPPKNKVLFTKMHGLGNDFVIIDNRRQQYQLTTEQIKFISHRQTGVGCDQLLLIEASLIDGIDFKYRIYNADGKEVEQCGNGARCFAKYVYEKKLTLNKEIAVETLAGVIYLYIESSSDDIRVNMEVPSFSSKNIGLSIPNNQVISNNLYSTKIKNKYAIEKNIYFSAVSMGNPHITLIRPELLDEEVSFWGDTLSKHVLFKNDINVGFMHIINRDTIKLRVYERGAGETLACGSGACAAVVNGIQQGVLNHQVKVQLSLGDLTIKWQGNNQPVWMIGSANFVFEGQINI